MKHIRGFLLCPIFCVLAYSCSDPKNNAISDLHDLYEDVSVNSDIYTTDDWVSFVREYEITDSILNSYEFSVEEQKEIDELRGRCSVYLMKGAAKTVGNELNKALDSFGNFLNGVADELDKINENN